MTAKEEESALPKTKSKTDFDLPEVAIGGDRTDKTKRILEGCGKLKNALICKIVSPHHYDNALVISYRVPLDYDQRSTLIGVVGKLLPKSSITFVRVVKA